MLATTIHKSNTTPHHQRRSDNQSYPRFPTTGQRDSGPVASKPNSVSGRFITAIKPVAAQRLLLHPSTPTTGADTDIPTAADPTSCGGGGKQKMVLLRKEVIQPHLPVRLPCYDFVPIADPTFDGSLPRVRPPASGVTDFHDVTGGVYKARERIHRSVADLRLLATPTSRGRVADPDPN